MLFVKKSNNKKEFLLKIFEKSNFQDNSIEKLLLPELNFYREH